MKVQVGRSYLVMRRSDNEEVTIEIIRKNATSFLIVDTSTDKKGWVPIEDFDKVYGEPGEEVTDEVTDEGSAGPGPIDLDENTKPPEGKEDGGENNDSENDVDTTKEKRGAASKDEEE